MGGIDAGKGGVADITGDGVIVHSDDSECFGDGDSKACASVKKEWGDVVTGDKDSKGKGEGFEPFFDTLGIAVVVFLMGFGDGE